MRVDPITRQYVKELARMESRTDCDALRVLVAAGVMARHGGPNPVLPPEHDVWLDSAVVKGGKTISAHMPSPIRHAVERIAEREGRSLSGMLKTLLREALSARRELPPIERHANDPVLKV